MVAAGGGCGVSGGRACAVAKRVCGAPPPPRSALGAAAPRRARKGARLAGGLTKAAPPAKRRPRWAGAKARGQKIEKRTGLPKAG